MFQLLPEQQKELLSREYYRRRMRAGLVLGTGVLLVGCISLAPKVYVAYSKKAAIQVEENKQQVSYDTKAGAYQEIQRVKNLIDVVEKNSASSSSQIIRAIVAARPNGVRLSGFTVAYGKEGGNVQVQGTAATREMLRTFIRNLDESGVFTKAVVPVSNFAQETDLVFTFQLHINSPTP